MTGFKLKVFTPNGLALETQVQSAYLPTVDGEIGILEKHTKYTGLIGNGDLKYQVTGESGVSKMHIEGGFCNFATDELVILADKVA